MKDIETRIDAILAKFAATEDKPEKKERTLQVGDMVLFDYEGATWKGMIEHATDDEVPVYTVRVYAEANGMYEATDVVYQIASDAGVEKFMDDALQKGDFVAFDTKAGPTLGIVTAIAEEGVTVEVIDEYGGERMRTGIEVTHPKDAFRKTDPIAAVDRVHRIMAKMNDVKMSITTNEEGEKVGVIEGYASTYGNTDLGGDIVKKGAFTQTLSHKGYKTLLLFDHGYKTKDIAGVAFYEDDENGLRLRGEMPLDNADVSSAYNTVKFVVDRGVPMGLSIGYMTKKSNMLQDGRRELTELSLEETSITPFPMNLQAQITAAKGRRLIFASKSLLWNQLPDAPDGNGAGEGDFESLLLEIKQTVDKTFKL